MPLPAPMATFNKRVTNRVTRLVAGHLPGFGIIIHQGRRSGRIYRTPVNVFRRYGGFDFALTYGEGDWVHNVIHAGTATLITRGAEHQISNPYVMENRRSIRIPLLVRAILRVIRVDSFLRVDALREGDHDQPHAVGEA